MEQGRPLDKYYTDLDIKLRELAEEDWATFCQLVGDDAILTAKICYLRAKGMSLTQVENKLGVTRRKVQWNSTNNCPCSPEQLRVVSSHPPVAANVTQKLL